MSLIGQSVKRLEDRPLLTGSGRFAADITVPDMLYMRLVRSPVAFGRLTGLQIAEALAHPGTIAVWTAEDVADIPPIGFRMTSVPGLGASGRSPAKTLSMIRRRARVHGRRLAWRFGWQRSGDRSVLGCAVRASGGVAEPQRARV